MHDGCCVHVNRRRPVGALQWIVLASADSICGPRRARRLVFGEIGAGVGPGRIVRICAGLAVLLLGALLVRVVLSQRTASGGEHWSPA